MSKVSSRFFLHFFNFFGVFCFKYENNCLTVSNFAAVFNIIKMPLAYLVVHWLANQKIIFENIYGEMFDEIKDYSSFSRKLVLLCSSIVEWGSFVVIGMQMWKRQKVLSLITRSKEMLQSISQDWAKVFEKAATEVTIVVLLLLSFLFVLQFLIVKFNFSSVIYCLFLLYPYYVFLVSSGFVKICETFFVVLLKELEGEILSEKTVLSMEKYFTLTMKVKKIYDLNQAFAEIFEAQLTILTCCASVLMTLDVRKIS